MKVSEAFLVNTKNFESIIGALVSYDSDELVIDSSLLEILGYADPNDLLVIRLLKDFNIITNDGEPGKYFDEFKNPKTTQRALARGVLDAYSQLFEMDPKIHQASIDKIKETFEEAFDGEKTDLIIKYISGTFQKVVTYVGAKTIDAVRKESETQAVTSSMAETAKIGSNNHHEGKSNSNFVRESIGNKNIDDLVNDFDAKKSGDEIVKNKDNEPDFSIKEFEMKEIEEEEIDIENEDPFGLEDVSDDSEQGNTPNKDLKSNGNSDDLESLLPSVNHEPIDKMENTITTEGNFVQKALIRKSDLLHKLHRWDELLPTLEEIIKRYDNEEHSSLKDIVSRSIIRQAMTLLKLNRPTEALPILNNVISRFKDSTNKEFYDHASKAMLFKAQILEKEDSQNLLPLYNMIVDRLDSSSEILVKEKLNHIYLKRYDLILQEGSQNEILEASTGLIERFKNNNEHREYLQKAMIKRAEILDELGHDEEALKAYDDFLENFGD